MWFKLYDEHPATPPSCLIGDDHTGTAIVVDPGQDVAAYLADAEQHRLRIRHVFLTGLQADRGSGHVELCARTGSLLHLSNRAEVALPFIPYADSDSLTIGSMRLEILETPCYAPQGISVLVYDLEKDPDRPQVVLGGDYPLAADPPLAPLPALPLARQPSLVS
ncbi:MAG: hypothetical protein U0736_07965 [Gemmataceae bacterium]